MKRALTVFTCFMVVVGVQAVTITHSNTTINIDFVDIGYAGNTGQTYAWDDQIAQSGVETFGAVNSSYRIGKFEVTSTQWASVIAADLNVGNASGYSGQQPVANASWYEAAKFCNWLTSGSYNNGAYQFSNPTTLTAVNRGAAISTYGTVYVLPTEDEWFKAAYFKSDGSGYTLYATGDTVPIRGAGGELYAGGDDGMTFDPWDVGSGTTVSIENNGTFDMNGNVWELNESAFDGNLDDMMENRAARGGDSYSDGGALRYSVARTFAPPPDAEGFGFRVAAIPEPSSLAMIGLVSGCAVFVRRRFMI
jgi:sulfatase modifying factor 1